MKRKNFSAAGWLVLLALAAAGAVLAWTRHRSFADQPRYQTVTVKRADIVQSVTATGQLSAVVNVQVGSQISGNIKKLSADFNTPVKAGQVVAELDASTYQANVNAMEGELESARASVELARLNEKRKRQLAFENAAPAAELEKAVADLNQALALVKMKQAALDKARVDLVRCTITAPVDGIVISRNVDVGQTVAATMTAPVLFTIANDLTRMNIEANVSEADIGGVREGQSVTFAVDAFPDRAFQGKVVQVRYAPVIVENVVSYVTVIEVSNPKLELRPGMTANVSIELARRDHALALPNAALRFRPPDAGGQSGSKPAKDKKGSGAPAKRVVYRLSDGAPTPAEVQLGISDAITTEMISGLEEGDVLVTGILTTPGAANPSAGASPLGGAPPAGLGPPPGGGGGGKGR